MFLSQSTLNFVQLEAKNKLPQQRNFCQKQKKTLLEFFFFTSCSWFWGIIDCWSIYIYICSKSIKKSWFADWAIKMPLQVYIYSQVGSRQGSWEILSYHQSHLELRSLPCPMPRTWYTRREVVWSGLCRFNGRLMMNPKLLQERFTEHVEPQVQRQGRMSEKKMLATSCNHWELIWFYIVNPCPC